MESIGVNHGSVSSYCNSGGGMAHIYRLIFCFFAFFPVISFASVPKTMQPNESVVASGNGNVASCSSNYSATPSRIPCYTGARSENVSMGYTVVTVYSKPAYWWAGPIQIPYTSQCPANSTSATSTTCNCVAPAVESGSTCVVPPPVDTQAECNAVAQGLTFVDAPLVHYGSVGLTACYGGYVVEGTGSAGGGGQSELYGPFKCSGQSASACTSVPKPSSIVTTCAAGSYPGTVNGVQVCVPPSSIVDAPKTTTATPPTSGASAPAIPNAPPGTTSTTEQTTCTGTQCTTTTTFKNESGASLGTQAESKPVTSFCAENPTFSACKEPEKNKWGAGSCASPPPCSGDAVMCAIALESFKTSCSLAPPANSESALYDSEKTKTGAIVDTLPGSKTVGISSASFNTTNAIGGGSGGMADKTVVIAGHSVTIPFSNVNSILGTLGTLLMGIGFLLAGRIVTRG